MKKGQKYNYLWTKVPITMGMQNIPVRQLFLLRGCLFYCQIFHWLLLLGLQDNHFTKKYLMHQVHETTFSLADGLHVYGPICQLSHVPCGSGLSVREWSQLA